MAARPAAAYRRGGARRCDRVRARAARARRRPAHAPARLPRLRALHNRLGVRLPRVSGARPPGRGPGAVIEAIELSGGRVRGLEIEQEGDRRSIAADVELRGLRAPDVVAAVGEIDGVLEVRWSEE